MRIMLSKKYRLSRKEINLIHKKGRRFGVGGIGVKCLKNQLGYSRFAVNVPVSVSKKATERNRIRRIVYDEIGKTCLPAGRAKPTGGTDCLIGIYRKDEETAIRQKIKSCLSADRKICVNL